MTNRPLFILFVLGIAFLAPFVQSQLIYDVVECTSWWATKGYEVTGSLAWNFGGVREKVGEAYKLYKQCRTVPNPPATHRGAWNSIEKGGAFETCTTEYGFRTWPGPGGDDSGKAFNYFIKTWDTFLPNIEVAFLKTFQLESQDKNEVNCEEIVKGTKSLKGQMSRNEFEKSRRFEVVAQVPATLVPSGSSMTIVFDNDAKASLQANKKTIEMGAVNQVRIKNPVTIACSGKTYTNAQSQPIRLAKVNCLVTKKDGTTLTASNEERSFTFNTPKKPAYACNPETCVPVENTFEKVANGFWVRSMVDGKPSGSGGVLVVWNGNDKPYIASTGTKRRSPTSATRST